MTQKSNNYNPQKHQITSKNTNPYLNSTIIYHLSANLHKHKPLRVAFLDIDKTITGSHVSTDKLRLLLKKLNYAIVYVTARTEEMVMSSHSYILSRQKGFKRPPPKLGYLNNKRIYIKPETIEPLGILDPDIIAGSTGTQILIKQKDGSYINDSEYISNFIHSPSVWRKAVYKIIRTFNRQQGITALPDVTENRNNYYNNNCDIYPVDYRIVICLKNLKDKINFIQYISKQSLYTNIGISDDSDNDKHIYRLHLTPLLGNKMHSANRIVNKVCFGMKIASSQLNLLISGDSFNDLEMGLKSGQGTRAKFILPGGSKLSRILACGKLHHEIHDQSLYDLKACLEPERKKGIYTFIQKILDKTTPPLIPSRIDTIKQQFYKRPVYIADEIYRDRLAADSLLAILPSII